MRVFAESRQSRPGRPVPLRAITLALGKPMPPIALAIRTIHLPKSFLCLLLRDYPVCIDPKPANAGVFLLAQPLRQHHGLWFIRERVFWGGSRRGCYLPL